MSKFSEQKEVIAETKAKDRFVKEQTAKTIHNMSVVAFTGMVVGCFASIMQQGEVTISHIVISVIGILISVILILMGNYIGRK